VIRLRSFNDTFLYVARLSRPPWSLNCGKPSRVVRISQIEVRRLGIPVASRLMFAVIELTILMASVFERAHFATARRRCGGS